MHTTTHLNTLIGLGVATLLAAAGCKGPSYIEVEPTDVQFVRKGQALQLKARAMDQQGHYYPEVLFDWVSEKPDVVEIDMQGRAQATGSGTAYVYARADKLEGRVLVRVNLVEKIVIHDKALELSLEAAERVVPKIEAFDYQGTKVVDRQIFLKPRDEGIVTIDGQGGVWAQAIGETVVDVNLEGKTGEFAVKVVK
ncbi:MAG: hypothetical protein P1V51_11580 [Deltaproteobacteria bacterium]|nr:hypothetical protein [Deltaproteobacteria bacterium]